jgi:predicted metalloenzyme YecM
MHKNLNDFKATLTEQLEKNHITLKPNWVIDHICYRVATEDKYNELKDFFLEENTLLVESIVSGRLIASFKLSRPINILGQNVSVLELPAPKAGKDTPEGYEHIEVVCTETFDELINLFSHLKLDKKGMSKNINPELEIELDTCSIKFHHQTLESVIEYEKSLE